MKTGCKYGTHRVIEPKGVLPQPADIISNSMELYDNEILIDVQALNIDSASFRQLHEECLGDHEKIKSKILEIVNKAGKMKNPVTGSGGMLIGTIEKIGEGLKGKTELTVGDKIVTLVSLSLTPLKIEKILSINDKTDRVNICGKAILFQSGLYAKIPSDIPEEIVLAALDVAGAPAQTAKIIKEGDKVLVLGAGGKSGILCCYQARKMVGPKGLVIGVGRGDKNIKRLQELGFCDKVLKLDATDSVSVYENVIKETNGDEYDVSINCLNVPNCEMSCILPVKDGGIVYFFSMATSFTKAALGAEGVGKDVNMIVGNGYTRGHADFTLSILRESPSIMNIFNEAYVE
jgi:L-erythro-3,5-diaminohexanoate dehydrogenase